MLNNRLNFKKEKNMGIIIGGQEVEKKVVPPEEVAVETVSEPVSDVQTEVVAAEPAEEIEKAEEPKKPVRRSRRRK